MNADGQLELKRDVLSVPVENNSSECASAGRRQLLRDSLRQSISAKRAVDRMKKIESQQIENEDFQSGTNSTTHCFKFGVCCRFN